MSLKMATDPLTKIAYKTLQQGKSIAGLAHKEISSRIMNLISPDKDLKSFEIDKNLLIDIQKSMDELREEQDYPEKRKWITKYIHDITVLDFNKDTKQHTIVVKFRLPLFNDKFSWKLNKDGSHKTDKWGRWIYEVLDGEKITANPFTHQKLFNRH